MITQVNSTNNDKYTILFKKVTDLLHENGELDSDVKIHTLDQYFNKLGAIADIAKKDGNYSLLRLPLDEEPFYINLDDRSITIPDAFKKSGLGIKNDEFVETIYFAVDPFFDTIAINGLDIAIEWENAAANTTGLTAGIYKQYDNISGKYIFGWPLTSAVTKAAGTVKFSVRFYKLTEDTQVYLHNLSTTTAELTVRDSLVSQITSTTKIDKLEEDMLNRIVDSTLVGTPVAQAPYFVNVSPDKNSSHRNQGLMILGPNNDYTDITEANNSTQNVNTTLYVLSGRADTGTIDYKWYFKAPSAENAMEIKTVPKVEYRQGTYYDTGLVYYVKDEDTGEYSEFNDPKTDLSTSISNGEYFNRYSTYILGDGIGTDISKIGDYYAVATNTVINDKASTATIACKIEGPTAIETDGDVPTYIVLKTSADVSNANNTNLTNNITGNNTVVINSQTPDDGTEDTYSWGKEDAEGKYTYGEEQSSNSYVIPGEGIYHYRVNRVKNGGKITGGEGVIEAVYNPLKGNANNFELNHSYESVNNMTTIAADETGFTFIPPELSRKDFTLPNEYKCVIEVPNTLTKIGNVMTAGDDGKFTIEPGTLSEFIGTTIQFRVTSYKGSANTAETASVSTQYMIIQEQATTPEETVEIASYSLPSYKIIE